MGFIHEEAVVWQQGASGHEFPVLSVIGIAQKTGNMTAYNEFWPLGKLTVITKVLGLYEQTSYYLMKNRKDHASVLRTDCWAFKTGLCRYFVGIPLAGAGYIQAHEDVVGWEIALGTQEGHTYYLST